jgi:membrane-associated HD superfamily phosphohydrolase
MRNIINNKGFSVPVWAQLIVAGMMFIAFAAFCRAAHYPPIISVLTFFVGFHFIFFKKDNLKKCLYSALLLALMIVTADVMIRAYDVSPFLVPVASVVMLTVFLFNDLHLAFVMAFLSSAIVMMIAGADYRLMLVYFFGGMSGAYVVWNARTRGQFIKAALVMSVVQVAC